MKADHIIIFSTNQGTESDELVNFGLIEGSNRTHPGQGTRNRKFYFKNFFLEIAWVSDQSEVTSQLTAPTRLWERSNHRINGSSPFGLCLQRSADTDYLFENCLKYRPGYLSAGLSFDIITNEERPYLPWTCRLPSTSKNLGEEQTDHPVGIEDLTAITFGIKMGDHRNQFTELVSVNSNIRFQNAEQHCLTLEFDHSKNGTAKQFNSLPLIIKY